jgi:hypothetical protein
MGAKHGGQRGRMAESRHRARRASGQLVDQADAAQSAKHRHVQSGRQVRHRDGRRRGLRFHADHEGTPRHDLDDLLFGNADAGYHRVILNEDADSGRLVQAAQRRGGHGRIRVADLRHQGEGRTRHRLEQAPRLHHDRVGVAFGQAQHER